MSSERLNLPKRFTPKSLSEDFGGVAFNIPIYQRLFAWRDDQVNKLIYDLLDASQKGDTYYLGILTVALNDGCLDLIDGQQRMTVVTLMAIAFVELEPEKCSYWEEYLAEGTRLQFSARDEDNAYISARAGGSKSSYSNAHMERAIELIKHRCTSEQVDVAKFSEYVWQNLTLFCSYLPSNYVQNPIELNRYFEAMNSTGRQLKQHEILLVDLVAGHPNSVNLSKLWQKIADTRKRLVANCDGSDDEKAGARGEYEWLLAHSDSIFSDERISESDFETIEAIVPAAAQGSTSDVADSSIQILISFEQLLLMALAITCGVEPSRRDYQPEHLLARFEEARLKENGLVDSFFDTLYKCRLLMDYKIVWQETSGDFDYQIVTYDKDHRLEKFQSMLYVAHQPDFYRWLPSYIKWLLANQGSTAEFELTELKRLDRELHPDLPAVGELSYKKVERYWFWRLDYELWEHRNDESGWLKDYPALKDAVSRYVFRVNRSIEHLHPQTPTDSKSDAWGEDNLHRFGNLAMISTAFNSTQSNESAGVKMERIHHQVETSQLQSLKMLHMWITYKDGEKWTVDKASSHEQAMYTNLENLRNQ